MAWNKPIDQPKAEPKKKPTAWRGAVAGGVVALAAIVAAVVIFSGGDAKPKAKAKVGVIKEVKPAAVKDKAKPVVSTKKKVASAAKVESEKKVAANGSEVIGVAEKKRAADFSLPGDQLMVMAQPLPGGLPPPPIPTGRHTTAQFQEAMLKKIEIRATDSQEVRDLKERVMECRKEMMEALAQGKTVDEVLAEHQETLRYNFQVYNEQRAVLKEIFDSGDIEGAKQYCDTMNKALHEMGIQELRMPSSAAARKSEILRQRKAMKMKEGKVVPQ